MCKYTNIEKLREICTLKKMNFLYLLAKTMEEVFLIKFPSPTLWTIMKDMFALFGTNLYIFYL